MANLSNSHFTQIYACNQSNKGFGDSWNIYPTLIQTILPFDIAPFPSKDILANNVTSCNYATYDKGLISHLKNNHL
jgi:hypothetical protein